MRPHIIVLLFMTLVCRSATSMKHQFVIDNDETVSQFIISTFTYRIGGQLEVFASNLTFWAQDGRKQFDSNEARYGFVLAKTDGAMRSDGIRFYSPVQNNGCVFSTLKSGSSYDLMTFGVVPTKNKVQLRCTAESLPNVTALSHESELTRALGSRAGKDKPKQFMKNIIHGTNSHQTFNKCPKSADLPLETSIDAQGRMSYSFNFTMQIDNQHQEGIYILTFYSCKSDKNVPNESDGYSMDVQVVERNANSYLSAERIPLPKMYFTLSFVTMLIAFVWMLAMAWQHKNLSMVHLFITILVIAATCSSLLNYVNYTYMSTEGRKSILWAYLYSLYIIAQIILRIASLGLAIYIGRRRCKTILGLALFCWLLIMRNPIDTLIEFFDEETFGVLQDFSIYLVFYIPLMFVTLMTYTYNELDLARGSREMQLAEAKDIEPIDGYVIISTTYAILDSLVHYSKWTATYTNFWLFELTLEVFKLTYVAVMILTCLASQRHLHPKADTKSRKDMAKNDIAMPVSRLRT